MHARRRFSALTLGLTAALIAASAPAATAPGGLSVTLGPAGIAKLVYNGQVLLDAAANPADGLSVMDFNESTGNLVERVWAGQNSNYVTSWNAAGRTLTCTFAWGTVATTYTISANSVGMRTTVTNATAAQTIDGLNICPLALTFGQQPTFSDGAQVNFGDGGPGVTIADFGGGAVAVVEEDVNRPLYSGFLGDSNSEKTHRYQTWIGSALLPGRATSWPSLTEPIAPKSCKVYRFSLRFGPAGSTAADLAPDVLTAYAAANPYSVNWPDRRPIGMLFPAGSGPNGRSPSNPRGWFNDRAVNVNTPMGLALFTRRLLNYAASSVRVLKSMNAQGMITWDIEGEQYSSAVYVGDPRLATTLAPELTHGDVVDQYFAMFRRAGFRVGVTIRPQEFIFNGGHPMQREIADPAAEAAALISKISYARRRWNCTLFYIDSIAWEESPLILEQVHRECPDVLLMPESPNDGMYSVSAPFRQLRTGYITMPSIVRQTYPSAFNVIDTTVGDIAPAERRLVNLVRQGDILLFTGWLQSRGNPLVRRIYEEAGNAGAVQ